MTPVIFRKFHNGEVIALFPDQPGTHEPHTCLSYMHTEQHGVSFASLSYTLPASPEEYQPLMRELVAIGYSQLVVKHRFTRKDAISRTTL